MHTRNGHGAKESKLAAKRLQSPVRRLTRTTMPVGGFRVWVSPEALGIISQLESCASRWAHSAWRYGLGLLALLLLGG
jgi:hypothetical protein